MKKLVAMILMVATLVTCAFGFAACNNKKVVIGAQSGTTGESYIKGDADWGFNGVPNAESAGYENIALAVKDMVNGNIKYAISDKAAAEAVVAQNSDKVKIINIDLTTEKYAIGVNKDKTELLGQINTIMDTIKNDGTLTAIYAAYAGIKDGAETEPTGGVYAGIQSGTVFGDGTGGVLKVATAASWAPYEYKINETYFGIDMEIVKVIATTLNMKVVIDNMEFASVVTSVQTGIDDIAISCLTVNAVRAKSLTFANAYEEGASQVLIVMKDDTAFDNCKTADDVMAVFKAMK